MLGESPITSKPAGLSRLSVGGSRNSLIRRSLVPQTPVANKRNQVTYKVCTRKVEA